MLSVREVTAAASSDRQGMRLLISGRDAAALNHLKGLSQGVPNLLVSTRLVSNGHTDPLYGLEQMPDFLLLRVSHLWREELAALLLHPLKERPPLLVCGPMDEREGMRMAMQAGARDFLPEPVSAEDLQSALDRMQMELHSDLGAKGKLVAVMNAKGGSGASMLACNLAHQLSVQGGRTLLLDLDLQFGSLAHSLDVLPTHSHTDVLQQIDTLDSVALRGFCSHFSPSLHVLGGRTDELCLSQEIRLEQLDSLLRLSRNTYDWVVVDLPRHIDHLTGITLEQSDRVYIVLQQSLSHLQDANRLVRILRDDLGVQSNRLHVVVNRFDKSSPFKPKDISDALRCNELHKLPNDYAVVSESQNTGVPLELHAPRASITLSLRELSQSLIGIEAHDAGLLKRTFNRLFGG
ncbi:MULTISPECIES: AAA family ATPase [Pseudomonas]|uniref:Pilus assembly protein CpaE n=1 Tax=Pseudomonas psychrophila TaxID=122355 RepID=A0ABY0W4F2_9PSED|nr:MULTISPECIES: AAA family ATPase [Pseudomonas]KAB0490958.1 AAA family ATPase [Pseudomonas psychrophila]KMM99900.1 chemotaxis protein CheY [Pseudomonas psychrophila]MDY7581643.1 AAA family ATPase [Pseudomonas sp. CCI3.1]MEB0065324.1 AAA family ATPase [Pseudomonas sp. CCI3.1]MEB0070492.1 AAA family ATPase [Pseudomonas sp. CCI1.4]